MRTPIFAIVLAVLCAAAVSQCGGGSNAPRSIGADACMIADDVDGDGTADFVTTLTYDRHGRLVTQAVDDDGDGAPDTVAHFHYGKDREIDGIDFDLDGDGHVDIEGIPPG
jgi:hypothetical protein